MLCHGIEELGGGGKSSISPASTTNMWPQDMGKRLLIPSNTTSITNNKEKNSMTQVVSSSPLPNKLERAVLECPRCNSSNTKFCYYNNYSLSQPRHFCKACKRYWTRGGTLRNVPVGGGCRKNKRTRKPTPAPAPALTPPPPPPPPTSSSVHALSLPPLDSSLNHLFFSSSSEMGLSYPLPSSSPSCANFDLQPSHLSSFGLGLGYHHLISPLPSSDVFATNVDHHSLLQFEENANLGMVKFESGDILATNSTPLDPSFLYWNAPLF